MSEIHVSREDAKARRDIEEVAAIVVDGQLIVELKSAHRSEGRPPASRQQAHQLRVFAPSRAPTGSAMRISGRKSSLLRFRTHASVIFCQYSILGLLVCGLINPDCFKVTNLLNTQ